MRTTRPDLGSRGRTRSWSEVVSCKWVRAFAPPGSPKKIWKEVLSLSICLSTHLSHIRETSTLSRIKCKCKCRSLRFNRYSVLDWTLPPAPVASGWKVREKLPLWTPAGANSVFFKLTGMRDWRFSLRVTSKAKGGKRVNSLELTRFKSSLSRCVSFFGTFISAFVLFQFSCWTMYSLRTYAFYAEHVRE